MDIVKEYSGFEVRQQQLNDDYSLLSISLNSDSEESANKLSDINDVIIEVEGTRALTNEAAAYYNKKLYPIINEFERKLRKLLYAASVIKSSGTNTINNLESMDFGELFSLLFKDSDYHSRIKTYVNKDWKGFSSELISHLLNEKEKLLWDQLLSNQVTTLRTRFEEIRIKRNDVMHAHNISKKDYQNTKKLFVQVISEIDESISNLAEGAFVPDDYNEKLDDAFVLQKEEQNDNNPTIHEQYRLF